MTTQEIRFLSIVLAYIILFLLIDTVRARIKRMEREIRPKPEFTCNSIWFPCFKWILEWFYEKISIGYRLNKWNWLLNKFHREAAISEIYSLLFPIVGAVWIFLIEHPWYPFLSDPCFLGIGAGIAFYRPLEILLFSLHWVFVEKKPVEAYRRTVASSILNLFEISVYFTIIFLLLDWFEPLKYPMSTWEALRLNLFGAFSLEPFYQIKSGFLPQLFSVVRATESWILVALILGSVINAISRGEKDGMKKCPFCAEMIKEEAIVCRYCRRDIGEQSSSGG